MTDEFRLRRWQTEAIARWTANGNRGIASVVTGGGKTIFALACLRRSHCETALILVPTIALAEQWWEECAAFLEIPRDDIKILTGRNGIQRGTVNIAVLNTAAKLPTTTNAGTLMLVVDECHKAASPLFKNALEIPNNASLGLSATPERQYDDGLLDILIPKLGPIVYTYDYRDAMRDEVIVPFTLQNVVFDLEDDREVEFRRLSRAIATSISKNGPDAEASVALMLKRARVVNQSPRRVELALRIAASHRLNKILVFHEDIEACGVIDEVLRANGIRSGIYHSRLPLGDRGSVLHHYRTGSITSLVTCRALDEGFNVPDTEIGIIAASTATRRQRIQRLGRVLRPAEGKSSAVIYTLAATRGEIDRLKLEEQDLSDIANVSWSRA
ncbi:superfamily II DNA or RNA helicase [Luteibacter sp. OK325]|uniref:DEAD/DEAH box helicase n=1 Tax=Luteibacter sp. OK325 TaxID=2135670 RepID=UPI000D3B77B1|nr:DEAD/DEAH box helicase [Luteibacter sp. OK325]PTR33649.1 superfamily II DNA or RNA helicase [Luteibacter sp. OK325]